MNIADLNIKKTRMALFFISAAFYIFSSLSLTSASEISGPEVRLQNNEIFATVALAPDEKYIQEIKSGIKKELGFHIDLFRAWKMWPDEFVTGKSFVRTLRADPVKTEFIATSNDGSTQIKKRFRSFESMLQWALNFEEIKLANIRDLEHGVYFVRITVESRLRKLPPVIGYFMVFVAENEFRLTKDSANFSVGQPR